MRAVLLFLPVVLTSGCAATGQATDEQAPPAEAREYRTLSEAKQEASPDDIICRKEAVIGSRFPEKVCATRQEWELATQQSKDVMMRNQRGVALEKR